MGRVSMATRDDLVTALSARYGASPRSERGRILDEFVAVTGVHRKHAMKLLRAGRASRGIGPRLGRRLYDTAMREALVVLWEASDRICGKRLRPMMPILLEAMERHGHLCPASEIRAGLLAMSAATIDRSLREVRDLAGGGLADGPPPRPRFDAASQCGRSPIGTIQRPASSRRIWSPIAVRRAGAASSRR